MQEVHHRIHELREEYKKSKKEADFLPRVAEAIAKEARLLCFDEFQVKDIADAMILSRFFELLFAEGVTVVATSNRPPEDLYKDGLKRENFLPFIDLLKSKLDILFLDGLQDYRRKKLSSLNTTYFTPLGKAADSFIKNLFTELANHHKPEPHTLDVNGRALTLSRTYAHVAWCSFAELCAKPLAAGDYLAIAEEFDTLLLENIPTLSAAKRNEATRFITLIDVLYELKTHLICTAEAAPQDLYKKGDNRFEFERTISRLIEMQSNDYLK
jgi:cell division protein ZapE